MTCFIHVKHVGTQVGRSSDCGTLMPASSRLVRTCYLRYVWLTLSSPSLAVWCQLGGSVYFCSLSMTCSMSRRGWLWFELLRYRAAILLTITLFALGRIAVPAHRLLTFPTSDWPKGWNYDPRTSSPANFGELIYSRCADGSHYPSPRMFAIVDFE